MKKIISSITMCALLSGCATHDVVYKPVPVETTVSVPCHIPAVAAPDMPTASITPKNSLFEQVRALLAEIEVRKGYEAMLSASMKACQ